MKTDEEIISEVMENDRIMNSVPRQLRAFAETGLKKTKEQMRKAIKMAWMDAYAEAKRVMIEQQDIGLVITILDEKIKEAML